MGGEDQRCYPRASDIRKSGRAVSLRCVDGLLRSNNATAPARALVEN